MIKKVIAKGDLNDPVFKNCDLKYWLSRSPGERIEAVEYLRRQHHGSSARLQRTARIVQQI